MNDPDEYTYARDCFLEVYRDRPVFVDMVPRLLATSALLGLENNTKMFIGCLSPTDDDPGQWERYGDGGTGCAIGIDARFLVDWAGVNVRRVVKPQKEEEAGARVDVADAVLPGLHCLRAISISVRNPQIRRRYEIAFSLAHARARPRALPPHQTGASVR